MRAGCGCRWSGDICQVLISEWRMPRFSVYVVRGMLPSPSLSESESEGRMSEWLGLEVRRSRMGIE